MKAALGIASLCLVVSLSGCQSTGPRQATGGLLGAAAGGLVGAQFGGGNGKIAAAVIGALAGAAIGNEIGRSMDAQDRAAQRQATGAALESYANGESLPWQNQSSGNYGEVTPTRVWQKSDGTYCREFTQMVNVAGRQESAYGTACRQPDGTWKIVS